MWGSRLLSHCGVAVTHSTISVNRRFNRPPLWSEGGEMNGIRIVVGRFLLLSED